MDAKTRDRSGVDLARQQTKLIRELKAVRLSSGSTVADVARTMGVDEAVVYRFEKGGTNPTFATVRRYALAVGASLDLTAASAVLQDLEANDGAQCEVRDIGSDAYHRMAEGDNHPADSGTGDGRVSSATEVALDTTPK